MFSLILSTYVWPLRKASSGGLQTSASDAAWAWAWAWACALAAGVADGACACACLIDPAYLITCWVMVEAPCTIVPADRLAKNARTVAATSIPLLDQNVLYSTATVASITAFGTSLKVTDSRFWHSKRVSRVLPLRS